MTLASVLQILNTVLLAVFGVAGWRLVNQWRESREERHRLELSQRDQQIEFAQVTIESLKVTHKHALEKFELQISKLTDDNQRLSSARDEHTAILKQHIEFLKAQAPAGVVANFDGLKKLNEERLLSFEKQLADCQSARSREQSEHQLALELKETQLEQLEHRRLQPSAGCEVEVQNILWSPSAREREQLSRDPDIVTAANVGASANQRLIDALGHWNSDVRCRAEEALISRVPEVVPDLVNGLRGEGFVNAVLRIVGRLFGKHIQRYVTIIALLCEIGDPAVPELEKALVASNHGDFQLGSRQSSHILR